MEPPNYKIDETLWGTKLDLVIKEHNTSEAITGQMWYCLKAYKKRQLQGFTLWLWFDTDFEDWTYDAFKKGHRTLTRDLRDYLNNNGAGIEHRKGGQYARTFEQCLDEEPTNHSKEPTRPTDHSGELTPPINHSTEEPTPPTDHSGELTPPINHSTEEPTPPINHSAEATPPVHHSAEATLPAHHSAEATLPTNHFEGATPHINHLEEHGICYAEACTNICTNRGDTILNGCQKGITTSGNLSQVPQSTTNQATFGNLSQNP
ncbi:hypothetical protein B7494_g8574 [Chlorociboria aeruginascens]|nr:hypothetical protein B7494_g8574 [Chlorociboria aeruginascens]